jgi:threonine aldolase
MISFTCDYNEGAHPEILKKLTETNFQQEPGYGDDCFTQSAIAKIREATGCPHAHVTLLVGGTQTNATVIDAVLPHYGAVIAVETGHIAVHESGAIEFCGHKVITLPAHKGKMDPAELKADLEKCYADPTWPHMAHPGMV